MNSNVICLDQRRNTQNPVSTPPLPAGEGALPDPSVLIGLVVRHSLMFGDGTPVPDAILLPLMAQATRGCRASEAVVAWLYRRQAAAILGNGEPGERQDGPIS